MTKICYIGKKKFKDKYTNAKVIKKLKTIVFIQLNIVVLLIANVTQNIVYLQKLMWCLTIE